MTTTQLIVATLLFLAFLITAVFIFKRICPGESRSRGLAMKLCLLLSTLAMVFLLGEVFFKFFWMETDGFAVTLHTREWGRRNLHPLNSLGYRDIEHPPAEFEGKKVAFVVGDSFIEGAGTRDPANRISDRLRAGLGAGWVIVNLSNGGWGTLDELRAIASYPHTPDVIVLSYYINDIEECAPRYGLRKKLHRPHPATRWLADHSYFISFLYWRLYGLILLEDDYWEFIDSAFNNKAVVQAQERLLDRIINFARRHEIELHILVFPSLADVSGTRRHSGRIAEYLAGRGVSVIDLGERLIDREPADIMASPRDAHPSDELHIEVAELLLKLIGAGGG